MTFVTRWEGEWDPVETPVARLSAAWTDPATMREWLAVMQARGGYCTARTSRRESDGVELFWLSVTIPRTGLIIVEHADGREQRFDAPEPDPDGPGTLTIDFSWSVSGHGYPTPPEKQAKLAAYAARHPERIEERS